MTILDDPAYFSAVSMGASILGRPLQMTGLDGGSLHCIWTGTPTGTLRLEVSNDPEAIIGDGSGGTWEIVDSQVTGGAAGSHLFDLLSTKAKYVRGRYERTGSTGTLSGHVFGQGPG